MKNLPIFATTISDQTFLYFVGRLPESENEFENFAYFIERGIDASVDWQTIYEEAAEVIHTKQHGIDFDYMDDKK